MLEKVLGGLSGQEGSGCNENLAVLFFCNNSIAQAKSA